MSQEKLITREMHYGKIQFLHVIK